MSQTPGGKGRRRKKDEQTYQPELFKEIVAEDFGHKIRRQWYEEKWWYSILDIIAVLTETRTPSQYWYNLKQRMENEQGFQAALA